MNDKSEVPEAEATQAEEPRPVLVEAEGVQCMAFQDCYGKWRRFYDLQRLSGNVEIVTSN